MLFSGFFKGPDDRTGCNSRERGSGVRHCPTNKGAEAKGCLIRNCQQFSVGKMMEVILRAQAL